MENTKCRLIITHGKSHHCSFHSWAASASKAKQVKVLLYYIFLKIIFVFFSKINLH